MSVPREEFEMSVGVLMRREGEKLRE